MYIFCSRSIKVPKGFKILAIQLHEGRDIYLSKLILGFLYENLNQAVTSIKEYQSRSSLIIPGPIWLFQLWLLATFRTKLAVFLPTNFTKAYEDRSTEGIGLAMLRYGNRNSQDLFSIAYEAILGCELFTPSLTPFTTRARGPAWFRKELPATSIEDEAEINAIWKAYLTPTFPSSRTTTSGPYGVYGYQPDQVARQFGLVQPKPSSLCKCLDDLRQPLIEHVWRSILRKTQYRNLIFEPTPFALSHACTEAIFQWWQDYYRRQTNRVNPDTMLPQLISAFDIVQKKSKKSKGTHIREIQAFQKKIKTAYDPLHLKRTVHYAAQTLRDKTFDKIPTMKFPPFTPSKYLFALHFKMKFPSLPTSKLALAFRPPYPKWLPCDSLLGMSQKIKTKEKDKVTATKCNLYTFKGHLHLDLPHIQIISPIGIGKKSFNF